jgi:2-oxoisovalerate dehydrogenase E1 component
MAPGELLISAIGSGPADETVDLLAVHVAPGARISAGQTVAQIEATKSAIDVDAPCEGEVLEVLAQPGQRLHVGQPLLRVKAVGEHALSAAPTVAAGEVPVLRRRAPGCAGRETAAKAAPSPATTTALNQVFISRPSCVLGRELVETSTLAATIDGWSAHEAERRTGIARRHWVGREETAVDLATRAATNLLEGLGSLCPLISAVICSVTMPQSSTPSIASQVAAALAPRGWLYEPWAAYDFNAACSGFLYGVRLAADHLSAGGGDAVLLLTAEVLSPILDRTDPVTVFLFGDGASAVLVTRAAPAGRSLRLGRPLLAAEPDPEGTIQAPCHGAPGSLRMDGMAVARAAYKTMVATMQRALAQEGLAADDLAAVIPHPGSKRILQNVAEFLEIPHSRIWQTIGDTGNTSSTSIPLALDRFWNDLPRDKLIGLVAFGAGYTSAATVGQFEGD